MENRTDQVRRDIEQIRGDLGETLEALGDRVAPGKVAARTKEKVADKVEDVREQVSPSRVVKRQSRKVGDSLRRLMGSDDDNAVPAIAGRSNDGTGQGAGLASTAINEVQAAPRALQARAKGNPLAFGLLTFAGGFLLASVLPPTEREHQASQRIMDGLQPVVQEAVERGRAVAGELGQSAQDSLQEVKRTAVEATDRVKEDAVTSAADLKAEAQNAVSEAKEEAQQAAEQIKSGTQSATDAVAAEAVDPMPSSARPAGGIRASSRPRPLRAPSRAVPSQPADTH